MLRGLMQRNQQMLGGQRSNKGKYLIMAYLFSKHLLSAVCTVDTMFSAEDMRKNKNWSLPPRSSQSIELPF